MLHFWIDPPSALADCTLKASPWRTTFKILVSIYFIIYLMSHPFMRPLEISIKNCRAIAAEQACGSPLTARECHKPKNMKKQK
jgi:hypothetical protein